MHYTNNSERINELAKKWKDGTITPEERAEFERWYDDFASPGEKDDATAAREGRNVGAVRRVRGMDEAEDPVLRELLFRSIREKVGLPPVVGMSRRRRLLSAAAAVLLLLGVGTAWLYIHGSGRAAPATVANQYHTLLPPGSTKATLTLSDGKVVPLEKEKDSTIKDGNGVRIRKTGGQLVYQPAAAADEPVTYNTINVPRGGQYQLVLSDGTGVWLNSASSLRYPTVFRGDRRTVTLTGEGYFEVAKDKDHVFQVVAGGQVIDVLGTQFNINSYADEMDTRTTLLEGSVKVWLPGKVDSMLLRRGQQSVLGMAAGRLSLNERPDLEQVVAWKNGYFQINDADIRTIMRQVARWYDVEVSYEGEVPVRQLSGKMRRSASAAQFLDMLSYFNMHFRIEGRRIIVMA